jgi:hypothetical protein
MLNIFSSIRLLGFRLLLCGTLTDVMAGVAFATERPVITIAGARDNDLYLVLKNSGLHPKRYANPMEAVAAAPKDSAVLLLADEYPQKTLALSPKLFQNAAAKGLHLYVEFPSFVPELTLDQPKIFPWERLVISGEQMGNDLPKGRLLMANECYVQPTAVSNSMIVSARVAGYDTAVYGIPKTAKPVLFTIESGRVIVSTTKLSGFVQGRFAPTREWAAVWNHILSELTGVKLAGLKWEPRAQPAYRRDAVLPATIEANAFGKAARWFYDSHLLIPADRFSNVTTLLEHKEEAVKLPRDLGGKGNGRYGILEGYASSIQHDGDQPQRLPIRADCQAESAMVLAMDWRVNGNRTSRQTASNLLDFLYFDSDLCQGDRGNPRHPSFGLIGWGSIAPSWKIANYGDDNARVMLATMLAVANLKSDRWDESLLRGLAANLRTTGKLGFRGDRIDQPDLERNGWRHFQDRDIINYCPPFEAYNWACFLWAYQQTGDHAFLDKTKTGISMTMKAFPDKWRWNDNSERARMLLCLAWLVRVEDTEEHRQWASRVANELIAIQDESGAIPERFRGAEGSHYSIPKSNEAYGTGETPLLQQNGDPVSDQLYVTGFTLLAFHEAAAALHDSKISAAEDKLAKYLCRIQIHSKSLPYLNGTWFRAFDFVRWEPWASSGDAGWGAWSVEAGWGQTWTASVLGLRQKQITLWDATANPRLRQALPKIREQMAQNDGGPWQPK